MTETTLTLADALERDLLWRYGPLVGNEHLAQALGFPNHHAFRQALMRKQIPVPVFEIAHRRGRFALAKDIARWLAQASAPGA